MNKTTYLMVSVFAVVVLIAVVAVMAAVLPTVTMDVAVLGIRAEVVGTILLVGLNRHQGGKGNQHQKKHHTTGHSDSRALLIITVFMTF